MPTNIELYNLAFTGSNLDAPGGIHASSGGTPQIWSNALRFSTANGYCYGDTFPTGSLGFLVTWDCVVGGNASAAEHFFHTFDVDASYAVLAFIHHNGNSEIIGLNSKTPINIGTDARAAFHVEIEYDAVGGIAYAYFQRTNNDWLKPDGTWQAGRIAFDSEAATLTGDNFAVQWGQNSFDNPASELLAETNILLPTRSFPSLSKVSKLKEAQIELGMVLPF